MSPPGKFPDWADLYIYMFAVSRVPLYFCLTFWMAYNGTTGDNFAHSAPHALIMMISRVLNVSHDDSCSLGDVRFLVTAQLSVYCRPQRAGTAIIVRARADRTGRRRASHRAGTSARLQPGVNDLTRALPLGSAAVPHRITPSARHRSFAAR